MCEEGYDPIRARLGSMNDSVRWESNSMTHTLHRLNKNLADTQVFVFSFYNDARWVFEDVLPLKMLLDI